MAAYETDTPAGLPAPLPVAPEGERCAECGAPLAADQRYCLECGATHAHARVDLEALYAPAAPPPALPRPPAPPQPPRGPFGITPVGLVGGVAAAACAFIVGIVLGLVINGDPQPVAQQPPVVNIAVPTPGPAAAAPTATPEPLAQSTPEPDAAATPEADAQKLDKQSLETQQNADPEQFQKESKKLDKAATEGTPPPTDDKKAGGGSDQETFE
ncbi:MAG TPA: zinc ribbon domain-containing protein [Solirubrobacteraceae bacterium]|nr:zinc ribbon domain-containing protein [Solirubrobacteraceae bacterium]